jgi:ribosome biogenesis protein UTP30
MARTPPDNLIDAHVSSRQSKLAIDALCAHELKKVQKQEEDELLPRKEQHVWLVVAVKQMHPEKKLAPFKIPIIHPLVDPRTTPICLITKDPQREYKDLLESHRIKFISRVVGLEKLKGKFKPFEARRLLLKENGLFLADARVIPLLPKLLGSKWFQAKKQPIPVCLTRKDLKSELERAISSTYMHQNKGTCTSIKISTLSQSPVQILANLESALPAIASHIKGGWSNIQSLHIKTNSSVSLPVWNCSLGDNEGAEGRWADLNAENRVAAVDEEAASSIEKALKKKGKKRSLDADSEKPKKRAKSAESADVLVATGASESPAPASHGREKKLWARKRSEKVKGAESTSVVRE